MTERTVPYNNDEAEKQIKIAAAKQEQHENDKCQEEVGQVAKVDDSHFNLILDLANVVEHYNLDRDCNMPNYIIAIVMYKAAIAFKEANKIMKEYCKLSEKELDAKDNIESLKIRKLTEVSK